MVFYRQSNSIRELPCFLWCVSFRHAFGQLPYRLDESGPDELRQHMVDTSLFASKEGSPGQGSHATGASAAACITVRATGLLMALISILVNMVVVI